LYRIVLSPRILIPVFGRLAELNRFPICFPAPMRFAGEDRASWEK
jgi:hypothetical protein